MDYMGCSKMSFSSTSPEITIGEYPQNVAPFLRMNIVPTPKRSQHFVKKKFKGIDFVHNFAPWELELLSLE